MPRRTSILRKAIYRMSVYLRCLQRLQENKVDAVSSEALAKVAGVTPTQLRKDLAYFGQFGHPGIGYRVEELIAQLAERIGEKSAPESAAAANGGRRRITSGGC